MNPIIIYTLPRTKGTATLRAAKRSLKLNEPIEIFQLANTNNLDQYQTLLEVRAKNQSYRDWNALQKTMSEATTASKFFGSGLQNFYPARKWFNDVVRANSHDVYVLLRNPKEILWSFVIALYYGFSVHSETNPGYIEISDFDIHKADLMIDGFLRFYPTDGKIVTFDTLPAENFDHSFIDTVEQNSMNKLKYVRNRDYVDKHLDLILKFYQNEWKDKTGLDIDS